MAHKGWVTFLSGIEGIYSKICREDDISIVPQFVTSVKSSKKLLQCTPTWTTFRGFRELRTWTYERRKPTRTRWQVRVRQRHPLDSEQLVDGRQKNCSFWRLQSPAWNYLKTHRLKAHGFRRTLRHALYLTAAACFQSRRPTNQFAGHQQYIQHGRAKRQCLVSNGSRWLGFMRRTLAEMRSSRPMLWQIRSEDTWWCHWTWQSIPHSCLTDMHVAMYTCK